MVRMGRPPLWRRVNNIPDVPYFKPAGVPLTALEEVQLSVEEVEAIRLKDLERLAQEGCAQRMSVSRTTFARILTSARQKMADALLHGKAIRIDGGNFQLALQHFRCNRGHEWDVPFEVMVNTPPRFCPACNTQNILSTQLPGPGRGRSGRGRRHRGGRNWQEV
ncbi:MAG TPA: DUF134 domain-containing protein [Dehalococcoidales bacterium]|nr:DUF134 domain-containing protein [Dehalococcoidales bacterium]